MVLILSRIAAAVMLIASAAACANAGSEPDDGRVAVVVSAYPAEFLATIIGGDRVRVESLAPADGEAHDLELTADQVDEVAGADVVIHLGEEFQSAVAAAAERSDGVVVDLLSEVEVVDDDPHVWLDPERMVALADAVEAALTEADDAAASGFARRSDRLQGQLRELDEQYERGLENCERRTAITSHDAFGYLELRYDLELESISGTSPEGEPDPERIAELSDVATRLGVTTVLLERAGDRVASTLAREAGLAVDVLTPLETLPRSQRESGADYLSAMGSNLRVLRKALGCS